MTTKISIKIDVDKKNLGRLPLPTKAGHEITPKKGKGSYKRNKQNDIKKDEK